MKITDLHETYTSDLMMMNKKKTSLEIFLSEMSLFGEQNEVFDNPGNIFFFSF